MILLDEVSVISRIIEVEVGVIKVTETLIILDVTKTKSNNIVLILYIEQKKWKSCFCFFTDSKQHKASKLDVITLRNHARQSYMA